MDGDSHWLVVVEPGWINVLDREKGTWKSTPVSVGLWPLVRVIGSRIYYAFPGPMGNASLGVAESGILLIDPVSMQVEVLASSRRKEGDSLLNNVEPYQILSLAALSGERVVASICSDYRKIYKRGAARLMVYDAKGQSWQELHPGLIQDWWKAFAMEYSGGLLLQPIDVGEEAFLWENEQSPVSILRQRAKPRTLQAYDSASMAGIIRVAGRVPRLATESGKDFWLLNSTAPKYTLYHFETANAEPKAIPLEFESVDAAHEGVPTFSSLSSTESGLILNDFYGNEGVWFIPYRDLEEYLAAHPSDS